MWETGNVTQICFGGQETQTHSMTQPPQCCNYRCVLLHQGTIEDLNVRKGVGLSIVMGETHEIGKGFQTLITIRSCCQRTPAQPGQFLNCGIMICYHLDDRVKDVVPTLW